MCQRFQYRWNQLPDLSHICPEKSVLTKKAGCREILMISFMCTSGLPVQWEGEETEGQHFSQALWVQVNLTLYSTPQFIKIQYKNTSLLKCLLGLDENSKNDLWRGEKYFDRPCCKVPIKHENMKIKNCNYHWYLLFPF